MEEQDVMAMHAEGGEASQQSLHPMAELLEQGYGQVLPKRGDAVEGVIVAVSPSEILIDIGSKCEGIVTSRDLDQLDPSYRKSLRVGDTVLAYVIRPEDANGNVVLSLSRAMLEGDWREAAKMLEADEVFERPVAGYNKGGLIVNIGRVRGFVPASQVVSVRPAQGASDEEKEAAFAELVGQVLKLKIIELDRRRNRLILSERAAVREWRQEQKDRLLDELEEGTVRRGVVSSLCDFGAFVDLGGADGLVHLSELSWRRVGHPKQVLSVGQEVEVYVLSVDRERRRIALSLKRLQQEPWSAVEERYQIGQLVDCTITKLTDFGAFARVDEDIEGLVHISELSEERIAHPRDVVSEGQEVTLRIIRIDASRQRMGLSLRRVNEDLYSDDSYWQEAGQDAEPDDPAEDDA
ncbi:MAG TPA: S1 RNA-binding domain-containing protein [Chloroflexi bacterium]|jgi:small subunit ribosomal protein S1|nr:S1 RNA-binding domain-containing protein [Chloroflexota bacterium]